MYNVLAYYLSILRKLRLTIQLHIVRSNLLVYLECRSDKIYIDVTRTVRQEIKGH